jgi:hypothetical protein
MYTIESKDDKFALLHDGIIAGEYASREDAEKAQAQHEEDDARILKSLDEIDAQGRAGSSENLIKPLSLEDRFNALLEFLHVKHGIHVPEEIEPKE